MGWLWFSSGSWLPSPSKGSGEAVFFDIANVTKKCSTSRPFFKLFSKNFSQALRVAALQFSKGFSQTQKKTLYLYIIIYIKFRLQFCPLHFLFWNCNAATLQRGDPDLGSILGKDTIRSSHCHSTVMTVITVIMSLRF